MKNIAKRGRCTSQITNAHRKHVPKLHLNGEVMNKNIIVPVWLNHARVHSHLFLPGAPPYKVEDVIHATIFG